MFPDFIGIGAMRSGTSWLWRSLRKNPNLYLPPLKELYYFTFDKKYPAYNRPNSYPLRIFSPAWRKAFKRFMISNDKRWHMKYLLGKYDDRWYSSLFDSSKGKICGEISPDYAILDEEDVRRIHGLMPDLKVIFLMRNPIVRTWSQFKAVAKVYNRRIDKYSSQDIIKELDTDYYLLRNDYIRTLSIWEKYFSRERIFVGFFDDLVREPIEFAKRVCEFISVEATPGYLKDCEVLKFSINTRLDEIPKNVRDYLVNKYLIQMKELERVYGGHTGSWVKEVEKVAVDI